MEVSYVCVACIGGNFSHFIKYVYNMQTHVLHMCERNPCSPFNPSYGSHFEISFSLGAQQMSLRRVIGMHLPYEIT